jgi:hypothetical protein
MRIERYRLGVAWLDDFAFRITGESVDGCKHRTAVLGISALVDN